MAYFQTHKTLQRSVELKRLTSRNDPKLDLNFDDRWIVKSGAIVKLFIPLLFAFEALQNHHVKKKRVIRGIKSDLVAVLFTFAVAQPTIKRQVDTLPLHQSLHL